MFIESQESDVVTIRTKAEKPRNRFFLEDIELCAFHCPLSISLASTYENKGLQDKAGNDLPRSNASWTQFAMERYGSESISRRRQFLVARA